MEENFKAMFLQSFLVPLFVCLIFGNLIVCSSLFKLDGYMDGLQHAALAFLEVML